MRKSIFLIVFTIVALCACRERPSDTPQNTVSPEDKVEQPLPTGATPKADGTPEAITQSRSSATDSVAKVESVTTTIEASKELNDKKSAEQKTASINSKEDRQIKEGEFVLDIKKTTLFIGGICLLFLIIIYFVYRHFNREIQGFRNNVGRTKNSARIDGIERTIKELQNQLNSIQNARSSYAPHPVTKSIAAQQHRDEFIVRNEPSMPIEQVLYFSAIRRFDNDTYGFDASQAKISFTSVESKYRLTIKGDRTTAQVDIVAANFSDMINIPQDFVDPICQAEGLSTDNTCRVICLRPGQAELMGTNWVVIEKMIIRYE